MDMKAFCFNLVHGSIYGAEATTLIFSPSVCLNLVYDAFCYNKLSYSICGRLN